MSRTVNPTKISVQLCNMESTMRIGGKYSFEKFLRVLTCMEKWVAKSMWGCKKINQDKFFICGEEMTLILYFRVAGCNVSECNLELPSVKLENWEMHHWLTVGKILSQELNQIIESANRTCENWQVNRDK